MFNCLCDFWIIILNIWIETRQDIYVYTHIYIVLGHTKLLCAEENLCTSICDSFDKKVWLSTTHLNFEEDPIL